MVFGSVFGASLGAGVMFVNGFFSPYGTAGVVLPFQMAGMIIIGIGGGLYAKLGNGRFSTGAIVEATILGGTLTFIYDVVTNVGTAVSLSLTGLPFHEAIIAALISGIVPSIIHIVWNMVLFSAATVPLVNSIKKVLVWR